MPITNTQNHSSHAVSQYLISTGNSEALDINDDNDNEMIKCFFSSAQGLRSNICLAEVIFKWSVPEEKKNK